jgi:hypothetical protein
MYEEYLENFVFKTAKIIAMKLFGRVRKPQKDDEPENTEKNSDKENKPEEELNDNKNNEGESGDDEDVKKMLDEAHAKQQEEKEKRQKEEEIARAEYDSITAGLDQINFHLPLFLLLVILSMLSVPSVVTWAKNYHYSRILSPDPMLVPSTCVLVSLGFIWQMTTPRNM